MRSRDPDIRLPPLDDLPADTVAALCDFLRNLADAVENHYADRLIAHRRREYERDACDDRRADEADLRRHPDEPPF